MMGDAPETIWANCSANENWDDLNASAYRVDWWHEYRLASLHATNAQALVNPMVHALMEAATELHDKAVEKHQRHRSYIWPMIRKLRAALEALETEKPTQQKETT